MTLGWQVQYSATIGLGNKASARGQHSEAVQHYRAAAARARSHGADAEAGAALFVAAEDVLATDGADAELALLTEAWDLMSAAESLHRRVSRLLGGASLEELRAALLDS